MWGAIVIVMISLIFGYAEGAALARKKEMKTLIVFGMLLCLSVTLAVLNAAAVPLPNPYEGLAFVFGGLARLMQRGYLI